MSPMCACSCSRQTKHGQIFVTTSYHCVKVACMFSRMRQLCMGHLRGDNVLYVLVGGCVWGLRV